jgi:hypothetical protein
MRSLLQNRVVKHENYINWYFSKFLPISVMLKAWLVIINILTKYTTLESHVQGLSAPFQPHFRPFFGHFLIC